MCQENQEVVKFVTKHEIVSLILSEAFTACSGWQSDDNLPLKAQPCLVARDPETPVLTPAEKPCGFCMCVCVFMCVWQRSVQRGCRLSCCHLLIHHSMKIRKALKPLESWSDQETHTHTLKLIFPLTLILKWDNEENDHDKQKSCFHFYHFTCCSSLDKRNCCDSNCFADLQKFYLRFALSGRLMLFYFVCSNEMWISRLINRNHSGEFDQSH